MLKLYALLGSRDVQTTEAVFTIALSFIQGFAVVTVMENLGAHRLALNSHVSAPP